MSEEELEDLKWQQTEYEENIISELVKENKQQKSQLQQKETIIKEVREYIKENKDKYYQDWGEDDGSYDTYLDDIEIDKVLKILDKENK